MLVNSMQSSQADDDLHLITLWLHGKSSHSQEAYKRDIEQFVDFVDVPLTEVKIQHLWDWMDHLEKKEHLPATLARKLAALKSLLTYGYKIGYLVFNVGAAVNLPKVQDKLSERILSEDDISELLLHATTLRNCVLLKLFYASGARVSELSNLYWGAVISRNHDQGQITLHGKGNKTRVLKLSGSVWTDLMDLKSQTENPHTHQPVFKSQKGGHLSRVQIWRIVRDTAKKAGFDQNISPHWFRHAHASHSLDQGAPIHLVKETLGHQSLTTTSRYTHARPDESSSQYLNIK